MHIRTIQKEMSLTFILTPPDPGETGYLATCAEFYEANGEGETEEDAIANLKESLLVVLDYRRKQAMAGLDALPVPEKA